MSTLSDGLVVRAATPADHEGICALTIECFGERETAAIRHVLQGGGFEGRWTVVAEPDGRVVSCSVLLQHVFRYGSVEVPTGQIEFVATAPEHRRKGLIRAQFDLIHGWAEEAGLPLMIITGIPYVYRRLGYGYALDYPDSLRLTSTPDAPDGWSVTPATADDLPAIIALHGPAQDRPDLAVGMPEEAWAWHLAGSSTWDEIVLVARHGGAIEGFAWVQRRKEEGRAEMEGVARSLEAAEALLLEGVEQAADLKLSLLDRPGDPWGVVARRHGRTDPTDFLGVYARIPDPVALLDLLRPVLSERLAASPFAELSGSLSISLYGSGVVLRYEKGEVVEVTADPEPALDPLDDGGVGVAPDLFPALVLGRYGAGGLELRYDDVSYGDHRQLVEALFPKMVSDLIGPL